MLDLDLQEAMLYGIILKSKHSNNRIKTDERGMVYYGISNNLIHYWLPELTSREIKETLDSLEDKGYIRVLIVRHPNKRIRYVSTLQPCFNEIDILHQQLIDTNMYAAFGVGCYLKKFFLNREEGIDEMIGDDYLTDMANANMNYYELVDNQLNPTSRLTDIYDKFKEYLYPYE